MKSPPASPPHIAERAFAGKSCTDSRSAAIQRRVLSFVSHRLTAWIALALFLASLAPHFHAPLDTRLDTSLDASLVASDESGSDLAALSAAHQFPNEDAPESLEDGVGSCALCRSGEGRDADHSRSVLAPPFDRPRPSLPTDSAIAQGSSHVRQGTARAPPLRLHV